MMYSSIPVSAASATETNRVLRNAYLLLGITMLPTIAGAFVGAKYPIMQSLGWLSFVVFLGAMFGLQAVIIRNRNKVSGIGWLLVFTFVMGYFIGPMIGYAIGNYDNGTEILATAIGGTAAIFFVLAGYASTTRRNLSSPSLGKMLTIGMMMMFVIGILNAMFFEMPAVMLAVSSLFAVIAAGFILFTINRVVRGGETNYIMVTMTLYIMLLNIFQWLMHMLMAFGGSNE